MESWPVQQRMRPLDCIHIKGDEVHSGNLVGNISENLSFAWGLLLISRPEWVIRGQNRAGAVFGDVFEYICQSGYLKSSQWVIIGVAVAVLNL